MSHNSSIRIAIVCLTLTVFLRPADAVNLVYGFREGDVRPVIGGTYTGAEDANFFSTFADENVGQRTNLPFGASNNARILMRFNELNLLSGYQVQSAKLKVRLETTEAIARTINVYELLFSDWVEGTGVGVSGTPGADDRGVTYNRRNQTNHSPLTGPLWTTAGLGAGTDRGTTVLGTITIPASTAVGTLLTIDFNSAGLTVFNNWVNGITTNSGIFMQTTVESSNGMAFYSAQAASLTDRPLLELEIVVPEPSTFALLALGAVGLAVKARRRRVIV